jgi:hypothetical protein
MGGSASLTQIEGSVICESPDGNTEESVGEGSKIWSGE